MSERTKPLTKFGELLFPAFAGLGIAFGVTVVLLTIFPSQAEPMARTLGLTRPELAGALSLHLLVQIIAVPLAGALADRYGARLVIIVSSLLFAAGIFAASRAESRFELYLAFGLSGFLGAGASAVTYARVIVHRYDLHRGLALGTALTGTGIAGIVLPALMHWAAADGDWRRGFMWLALAVALVGLGAGSLAYESGRSTISSDAGGYRLRDAMRTTAFWGMVIAFGLFGAVLSGTLANLNTFWTVFGLASSGVAATQAMIGISAICGRLVGGFLMDRLPTKFVGAGAAIIGATGLFLFAFGSRSPAQMTFFAIAMGVCSGAESDVISYLSSRFYGVKSFARIYAVQASFFLVGFAAGPVAAAVLIERLTAPSTLLAGSLTLLVSSVVLSFLRHPAAHPA